MIQILKSIAGMLMTRQPATVNITDPTVYHIETTLRKYCGRIIYQDDVVIKLKSSRPKPVKIIKSNIEKITIIKSEAVNQYFRWYNAHLQPKA